MSNQMSVSSKTLLPWCEKLINGDLKIIANTVGERTVALKIIARCSITQTPTGQWNIDNVAD